MSRYPAYPEYKNSGIAWLGEIPAHWSVDRIKWSITDCKNGIWGDEPDGEDDLVCIRVADFDRQSFSISTRNLTTRAIKFKDRRDRLLSKGDLLLEKSGGGEQQLVGAVVEYNQHFDAVTSNFVARMPIAKGMDSRFLTYLHAHLYAGRVNYRAIKQSTGIQNLDSQQYLDERITYPPLDEQRTIARFLDAKTAQIDALIAKKAALLAALAEQRTALISHAVTRGLDPAAPMKDSGVAWLGEIPAGWAMIKLGYISNIGNGSTPNRSNSAYWDAGTYPWLNSSVVNQDIVSEADQFVTTFALQECHLPIVKPQSVLLAITGQGKTRGTVALLTFEATINQHLVFVYPRQNILLSNYLHILLTGFHGYLRYISDSTGGTRGALTLEDIKNLKIPVPPIQDQHIICYRLAERTAKIDQQRGKIQQAIDALREYRTALITNAVTGKIDVRGVAVQ